MQMHPGSIQQKHKTLLAKTDPTYVCIYVYMCVHIHNTYVYLYLYLYLNLHLYLYLYIYIYYSSKMFKKVSAGIVFLQCLSSHVSVVNR